jgi:replicative DNA helicase
MNISHLSDAYAEQALIGSLLIDNNTFDEINDYINVNDFTSELHRSIYLTIRELLSSGKTADLICVSQHMASKTKEDPFVQLCEIAQSPFTPKNVKHYADILKRKSGDRSLLAIADEIRLSIEEQKENRLDYIQAKIIGLESNSKAKTINAGNLIDEVVSSILENENNQIELPTGFTDIDRITNGLHGGDLIILAGRPGMGKTLLAMNIAEYAAISQKKTVTIFSMEMSKHQLITRSLSSLAKIDAKKIQKSALSIDECHKIKSLIPIFKDSNLFIDDRSSLQVSDIRAACRQIKREHGLSLIIIDYISLMSAEGENETLKIGSISRGLKILARDLDVPIIAISQLNRSVEYRTNKRPCMADLRQSGAIEQDADLIWFIYRDDVYDSKSQSKGIAEVIIAKHRNGETGTTKLSFNSHNCRFDNHIQPIDNYTQPTPFPTWNGIAFNY